MSRKGIQKLITCQSLAAPKMDVLQDKAGSIRNGGDASVIMYLRKKEKRSFCTVVITAREEPSENM